MLAISGVTAVLQKNLGKKSVQKLLIHKKIILMCHLTIAF
jgi:hypothetical protein